MLKLKTCGLFIGLLLGAATARADLPADYKVVLLTENFPPFNMAVDDKNFARDEGIDGISADIVREMFKRAGIGYTLMQAVSAHDYPLIQALFLIITLTVLAANLLVDVLYTAVDPRVRTGAAA